MQFYMRKIDKKFPCYHRFGRPEDYIEVETVEEPFDLETQRPGNWSAPMKQGGVFKSIRGVIDKTPDEIAAEEADAWRNLGHRRDAFLADTNAMMFEDAPISPANRAALKVYRKKLRDIMDPAKNGGKDKARDIRLDRFDG